MQDLEGEIIVVTGASGALGTTVVELLLQRGAKVVGWDISAPGPGSLVEDEQQLLLKWMNVDVTDGVAVEGAVTTVEAEMGPITAVIHCAGGFRWSRIDEISLEDIDFLVDLNLRSSLYLSRTVMRRFRERGRGRLIFVSSRSTQGPGVGEGAYAAAKIGLNALTRSLAAEVKELDVTVNAVLPSIIDTPANRGEMPDADFETWVPRTDLARVMEFLIGPEGRSVSGAEIVVSGRT